MTDKQAAHLMFETLNDIFSLKSPQVNMWNTDDIYARPVYLRFKFANQSMANKYHSTLVKILGLYSGGLQWGIYNVKFNENFLIMPKVFCEYMEQYEMLSDGDLKAAFGEMGYREIIDCAIADVPQLTSYLRNEVKKFI
jgi:hypothetical protein